MLKEEVFYKHVRETTFTKDYTVCGKVVDVSTNMSVPKFELHIGVKVFRVDEQFVEKVGLEASLKEATDDPLLKIKLDGYSLRTFLDFTKTLVPAKAIKKKVYLEFVAK